MKIERICRKLSAENSLKTLLFCKCFVKTVALHATWNYSCQRADFNRREFLYQKYFHALKGKKQNRIQRNLKKHLARKLLPETKAMKLPLRTSHFCVCEGDTSIIFGTCLSETVIWTYLMSCFVAPELIEYFFAKTPQWDLSFSFTLPYFFCIYGSVVLDCGRKYEKYNNSVLKLFPSMGEYCSSILLQTERQ